MSKEGFEEFAEVICRPGLSAAELEEDLRELLEDAVKNASLSDEVRALAAQQDIFDVRRPAGMFAVEWIAVGVLVKKTAITTVTGLVVKDLYDWVKAELKKRRAGMVQEVKPPEKNVRVNEESSGN